MITQSDIPRILQHIKNLRTSRTNLRYVMSNWYIGHWLIFPCISQGFCHIILRYITYSKRALLIKIHKYTRLINPCYTINRIFMGLINLYICQKYDTNGSVCWNYRPTYQRVRSQKLNNCSSHQTISKREEFKCLRNFPFDIWKSILSLLLWLLSLFLYTRNRMNGF